MADDITYDMNFKSLDQFGQDMDNQRQLLYLLLLVVVVAAVAVMCVSTYIIYTIKKTDNKIDILLDMKWKIRNPESTSI